MDQVVNHLRDRIGIQKPDEISVLVKIYVGTGYDHQRLGRLRIVSGHNKCVDLAARIKNKKKSGLWLVWIFEIVPFARQRPQMHGARVVVGGQNDARLEYDTQNPNPVVCV